MDNLEKTFISSVTGIGKSLKNNMPRIGKRKASLSFSSAGKPIVADYGNEEEANTTISKIPHSPNLPLNSGASQPSLRTVGSFPELRSHLTNYARDPYKLLAQQAFQEMQKDTDAPQHGNTIDGVSLAVLTKVIQISEHNMEVDEPWNWQEVLAELSSSSGPHGRKQKVSQDPEGDGASNGSATAASTEAKSVFTFPKRLTNGDVRKV